MFCLVWFLVAIAEGSHPFSSRTRSLSPPAPMILGTTRESRTLPGFLISIKPLGLMEIFFARLMVLSCVVVFTSVPAEVQLD